MDKKLLSILICPSCRSSLKWQPENQELHCKAEGIAFPIKNGLPVMMLENARKLTVDEKLGH